MELNFRLAQITDIHLAPRDAPASGNDSVLLAESRLLLARAVEAINTEADIDCVAVTGDLIDSGYPADLDAAIAALDRLRAPWYAIPGNHDVAFPPSPERLDRARFYTQLAAAHPEQASVYADAATRGSWTALPKPGVRLIGLDSNVPGDWGGRVDPGQLAWFDGLLGGASEPLVVVLVHHPLHDVLLGPKAPTFAGQDWGKFYCANGAQVTAILERHPRVRLVLCGHDHISRVDQAAGRLHIASPALSTYPLTYRTIHIRDMPDGPTGAWQTHGVADPALRERAGVQAANSALGRDYDPSDPQAFLRCAEGRPQDQRGEAPLDRPVTDRGR